MLIFGGSKDFNIVHLLNFIKEQEVAVDEPIILSPKSNHKIVYNLKSNQLILSGIEIRPKAIFLRHDVFDSLEQRDSRQISSSWYETLMTYASLNAEVKFFNKNYRALGKSYNLIKALELGFTIPDTIISNARSQLAGMKDQDSFIVKKVLGGTHTLTLKEFLGTNIQFNDRESLFYVQNRIEAPEYRVFGIGNKAISFKILSNNIDYRQDQEAQIEQVNNVKEYEDLVIKLMKVLNMDFSAVDLRTSKETGRLVFLEINSNPMFAKFDQIAQGNLVQSIIDWHKA